MKFLKQSAVLAAVFGLLSMLAGPASAASAYDPLTSSVTFVEAIAAMMAVAAVVAGLYVTMRGVRTVLGFIRR
ncbi:hypothetical protein CLU86_1151 [Acidovorax sp. 62]|uniref:hypothetical protein n=1 Tax=Acidovorax sp. 62 TaxID=2035203 RepID=UPI000C18833C|nr:hypothetical protein [Acidovorax sp. 62]PIF90270.1 hypothetical protein CLU86_1151 [Acidovorax sp. 62]